MADFAFQRELAAMRAELAEIRAEQRDQWMDEARAEQVRGIVRDVLADSSTRTAYRDTDWSVGLSSAPGGGVQINAADGAMSIKLTGLVQTGLPASNIPPNAVIIYQFEVVEIRAKK